MPDKNIFIGRGPSDPELDKSNYDLSFNSHISARFGRVYPCYLQEAVPGSSFVIKPSMAFDLMPMVFPIQTDINCHISFFKIPFRILMRNYKDFVSQVGNHQFPYIKRPEGWCETGSLADYLGVPSTRALYDRVLVQPAKVRFGSVYTDATNSSVGQFVDISRFYSRSSVKHNINHSLCFSLNRGDFIDELNPFLNFYLSSSSDINLNSINDYILNLKVIGTFGSDFFSNLPSGFSSHINNSDLGRVIVDTSFSSVSGGVSHNSSIPSGKCSLISTSLNNLNGNIRNSSFAVRLSDSVIDVINNSIDKYDNIFFCFYWTPSSCPLFGQSLDAVSDSSIFEKVESFFVGTEYSINDDKVSISKSVTPYRYGLSFVFYNAKIPFISHANGSNYFSSYDNADPLIPLSALPFRAYEFLHNYVFRNERVTPFIKNGQETYNEFLTNDSDGADSTTPVDFFNAPYEIDMFTSCVKTPQFGNAPLVGVSYNDADAQGILHMNPSDGDAYDIAVDLDSDANMIGISNYSDVADKPSVARLQEAIQFGISINDFRNVAAFQRFVERYDKAGYQYKHIVKEFYGTNAPIGEEFPEYLGGFTRRVSISKITNQSMADGAVLGDFAGTGRVAGQGETIKCFCAEQSYIMGLIWFTPVPVYSQVLPKHWIKSKVLDFFNPQFNNLGPQPVLSCEVAPLQMTTPSLTKVFGYNRPYVDLLQRFDECHGAYRDTMYNYLLQRMFDSEPELGEDFLYVKSEDLTNIFTVSMDTDKIFGALHFDVKSKLPIPRFSIPRIVG